MRILPGDDLDLVTSTWTIAQDSIVAPEIQVTGTIPVSTSTTTLNSAETSLYVGVAVEDPFLIVHQASDAAKASSASTAASPSKTNAAASVRGNEKRLGAVTIACCCIFALGALL